MCEMFSSERFAHDVGMMFLGLASGCHINVLPYQLSCRKATFHLVFEDTTKFPAEWMRVNKVPVLDKAENGTLKMVHRTKRAMLEKSSLKDAEP